MIIESVTLENFRQFKDKHQITFSTDDAVKVLEENKAKLGASEIKTKTNVAKVSVVGAGMMSNPGVAAKVFECLYNSHININMISTSEIRVTVLIDVENTEKAMNAMHDMFELQDQFAMK